MLAWLPLQNGMLLEAPQRQSVTRFLTSYGLPSSDSTVIPPRTHSGPLQPSSGSSIKPIEGGSLPSITFSVLLSCTTRRPAGQWLASRMASFRAGPGRTPTTPDTGRGQPAYLGEIPGTGHTWRGIDRCLMSGLHGLPGGASLAKLLAKQRGVRIGRRPPELSEKQILAWADAYFAAHAKWPTVLSGPIPGRRETWRAINGDMHKGSHGLRRGSSLAQLLAKRRRGTETPSVFLH